MWPACHVMLRYHVMIQNPSPVDPKPFTCLFHLQRCYLRHCQHLISHPVHLRHCHILFPRGVLLLLLLLLLLEAAQPSNCAKKQHACLRCVPAAHAQLYWLVKLDDHGDRFPFFFLNLVSAVPLCACMYVARAPTHHKALVKAPGTFVSDHTCCCRLTSFALPVLYLLQFAVLLCAESAMMVG